MSQKKPKKGVISKTKLSLSDFRKSKGIDGMAIKEKEKTVLPMSKAFTDALSIPGIYKGYVTLFRGFSNTGKSTGWIETLIGAQKVGDLVIITDTENAWDWNHVKDMGFQFNEVIDENTGEIVDYEGDFLFFDSQMLAAMYQHFDYKSGKLNPKQFREQALIDDVARLFNEILDEQFNGNELFQRNITMGWDSIGSLQGYDSWVSKVRNNQWDAGTAKRSFSELLNNRIPGSRKLDKQFTNTFIGVQKIWKDNMNGGTIMQNYGDAFDYPARMTIHMGGKISKSIQKLNATSGGKKYNYAIKCAIRCDKNHITGIENEGVIASSNHGFINPEKKDEYLKEHRQYLVKKLNIKDSDEIILVDGEIPDEELVKQLTSK